MHFNTAFSALTATPHHEQILGSGTFFPMQRNSSDSMSSDPMHQKTLTPCHRIPDIPPPPHHHIIIIIPPYSAHSLAASTEHQAHGGMGSIAMQRKTTLGSTTDCRPSLRALVVMAYTQRCTRRLVSPLNHQVASTTKTALYPAPCLPQPSSSKHPHARPPARPPVRTHALSDPHSTQQPPLAQASRPPSHALPDDCPRQSLLSLSLCWVYRSRHVRFVRLLAPCGFGRQPNGEARGHADPGGRHYSCASVQGLGKTREDHMAVCRLLINPKHGLSPTPYAPSPKPTSVVW